MVVRPLQRSELLARALEIWLGNKLELVADALCTMQLRLHIFPGHGQGADSYAEHIIRIDTQRYVCT